MSVKSLETLGELKYIPKTLFESLEQDGEKLTQLINGYIGYLKRSKQGQNEPGAKQAVRESSVAYDLDFSEDSTTDIPDSQLPDNHSR